ncbi:MAG: hypothetical protein AB8H03_21130 [Saprospiraceae bacterium]
MRFILIFAILSILCFNCNENSPLTADRVIDNSPIETEPSIEKDIKIGDHLPKHIYHKITEQPFVKKRIVALDKLEIDYVFWVNKSEVDSNKIEIQILAEDEIRWIPIYNFRYDLKKEELFHLDFSMETNNDTLILIK